MGRLRPQLAKLFVMATLWLCGTAAGLAGPPQGRRLSGNFSVGVLYSSIADPTFRHPGGHQELSIPQSSSSPGFLFGYEWRLGSSAAFGIRVLYFRAKYQTFAFWSPPGSRDPETVTYADPRFTHISGDLLVDWFPRGLPWLGVYAFLGLGTSNEKYSVSGAAFPQWNGFRSLSEFDYSYGLGLRLSPVQLLSLFAEVRLMPGDRTTEYDDDSLTWGYPGGYYRWGRSYTLHFTRIVSAGLTVNF